LCHFPYSVGEESYSSGTRPPLTDSPTFFVDPIGTFQVPRFVRRTHSTTYLTLPFLPNTLNNKNNRPFLIIPPAEPGRTGRWYNQLCARLPLRVHLHRPSRPAHPSPRGNLQPLPRASLQRRARRRLLPTRPHARTRHRHRHRNRGPTAPSARTSKRAAAALAGGCAHRGRVGLGPHTRTNPS
jgi:hypothetical protein